MMVVMEMYTGTPVLADALNDSDWGGREMQGRRERDGEREAGGRRVERQRRERPGGGVVRERPGGGVVRERPGGGVVRDRQRCRGIT